MFWAELADHGLKAEAADKVRRLVEGGMGELKRGHAMFMNPIVSIGRKPA